VDRRIRLLKRLSECFVDRRNPVRIEHSTEQLLAQRIYGLALGYEDLSDHDQLRADPLLAVLAGSDDPKGSERRQQRDRGKALAGKSTLNRLELTPETEPADRYKKIAYNAEAIDRLLVRVFLEAHQIAPEQIVIDLDATDLPVYGHQGIAAGLLALHSQREVHVANGFPYLLQWIQDETNQELRKHEEHNARKQREAGGYGRLEYFRHGSRHLWLLDVLPARPPAF
jgi:hypothetical protein